MKKLIYPLIKSVLSVFDVPPVQSYEIPQRPRRTLKIDGNRTTKTTITNGKPQYQTVEDDGTITTTIGKQKPKDSGEVSIDRFDEAFLDFVVGVKWRKDTEKCSVIKWHWMNERSAQQIESWHTDKQTRELERGYSERTVAGYITAFYDADDEREKQQVKRLRPPRTDKSNASNVIEW